MKHPTARILSNPESRVMGPPRVLALPALHASQAPPAKSFEQGYEQGHEEGLAAARREAQQRLEAAQARLNEQRETLEREHAGRLKQLEQLADALRQAESTLPARQQQAVVNLAYEALLRILNDAHHARPLIARIVDQSLREQPEHALSIRLSPQDYLALEADRELKALFARRPDIVCVADDTLAPGDCLIDSEQGRQDLSLATQLANLSAAWLGALGQTARERAGENSPRQKDPA